MAQFPAMPLWTDAFISDTVGLTAEETGGYLMLLMCAWRRPDCDLPDDDVLLQRWSRIDARRWPKVRDRIMAFWTLSEGRWTQKRLLREHEFVSRKRRIQADNARSKWLKNKETYDAMAMPNGCQIDAPTPTPTPIKEPPNPLERGKRARLADDDFERFWEIWPRKIAKEATRKKWAAAVKCAAPGIIIQAAKAFAENCRAKGTAPEYIPHGSTWLHQKRWTDETATTSDLPLLTAEPTTPPIEDESTWRQRAELFHGRLGSTWSIAWGPPPDDPRCRCPKNLRPLFEWRG